MWLDRNADTHAGDRLAEAFALAFPGATVGEFRAALSLTLRTLDDRVDGMVAERDEVRAILAAGGLVPRVRQALAAA